MSKENDGWCLQIAHGTWVIWAFGDYHERIERKHWRFYPLGMKEAHIFVDFDFSLEKEAQYAREHNYPAPHIIEERTCFAWRFKHESGHGDTWTLADTIQACKDNARAHVLDPDNFSIRISEQPMFLAAIENVVFLD